MTFKRVYVTSMSEINFYTCIVMFKLLRSTELVNNPECFPSNLSPEQISAFRITRITQAQKNVYSHGSEHFSDIFLCCYCCCCCWGIWTRDTGGRNTIHPQ